jgi:hypothetical protein
VRGGERRRKEMRGVERRREELRGDERVLGGWDGNIIFAWRVLSLGPDQRTILHILILLLCCVHV